MAAKKRATKRKKTPAKTREPEPEAPMVQMIVQEHGGALQRGGNNGGGRPRDEIRLICEDALRECQGIEVVKRIASGDILEHLGETKQGTPIIGDTSNKDRLTAIDMLMNRAYGKAPQKIEMSGQGTQGNESGEAVMQRLMAMIGRALLAAPAAQRLAVINEIERAEVVSG